MIVFDFIVRNGGRSIVTQNPAGLVAQTVHDGKSG